MNTETPNTEQWDGIKEVRIKSHMITEIIIQKGKIPDVIRTSMEIFEIVNKETERVLGNRKSGSITWADAKLMLTSTMQNCLNKLEST